MSNKRNPDRFVREIKRKTRRRFSAEENIRIVLLKKSSSGLASESG